MNTSLKQRVLYNGKYVKLDVQGGVNTFTRRVLAAGKDRRVLLQLRMH